MKKRFYVVIKGHKIGIFNQWDGAARLQVEGYRRALYKSFTTLELAQRWWTEKAPQFGPPPCYFENLADCKEETIKNVQTGPFITYLIIDPRNNLPFYVGQTSNLEKRIHNHIRQDNRRRLYKKTITSIQSVGLEPVFKQVDIQLTKADSLRSETEWVKQLASQGVRVQNGWREHKEWIDILLYDSQTNQRGI
jgi:hypothetical protein